jgi:hypothetical protein
MLAHASEALAMASTLVRAQRWYDAAMISSMSMTRNPKCAPDNSARIRKFRRVAIRFCAGAFSVSRHRVSVKEVRQRPNAKDRKGNNDFVSSLKRRRN